MRHRVPALALLCMGACTFAWEDFDPRLGETDGGTTGGEAGSAGSTGTAAGMAGSTGEGASGGSAGMGGMAGMGGAGGGMLLSFFDDFDRADSVDIGNGWIEKALGAFSLNGNKVDPNSGTVGGYRDKLVYRPPAEALLDVEASVEFELTNPNGVPQMFVRVQYGTIATADQYDGYNLWFTSSTIANLARQVGNASSTTLAQVALPAPLTAGQRYRMRLRAQGTSPVKLDAFVEIENAPNWTEIGSASFDDATPERFDTAGAVGFSVSSNTAFFYDDFRYDEL